MIYGYCRISTNKQNIERQIRNILKAYPDAIIKQEVYTGTKTDGRRMFESLLKLVRAGDTIVFDSVSRMSRNAESGFQVYQELYDKGVELVFLKEPHINTATYKKALSNNIEMTGTKTDIILKAINEYLMELAKSRYTSPLSNRKRKSPTYINERKRALKQRGVTASRLDGSTARPSRQRKALRQKGIFSNTRKTLTALFPMLIVSG